jgi:hypothetical protein
MKTRREFLATTIAAALLPKGSGQTAAPSGSSTTDEAGRKDTVSNELAPGGQYT